MYVKSINFLRKNMLHFEVLWVKKKVEGNGTLATIAREDFFKILKDTKSSEPP